MVDVTCHQCGKDEAEHKRQGGHFFTCSSCKSVSYCSKDCQVTDWKTGGHKTICKSLSVGDAKQVRHLDHEMQAFEVANMAEFALDPEGKKFFKLFLDSKQDDDHQEAARLMQDRFRRYSKFNKQVMFFRCISILINLPTEMLKRPSCPMTIALKYVDPNVLSSPGLNRSDGRGCTALHWLAESLNPNNEHSLKNQVVLGKQLIKAGANVNAKAERGLDRVTPLHRACHSAIPTNIDFIDLLLKNGANPNATTDTGETPLMHTMGASPSAALFLLKDSRTNPNLVAKDGKCILPMVRQCIVESEYKSSIPGNPYREGLAFALQQLRELESVLVERGAV